jgi:hypothetical protein
MKVESTSRLNFFSQALKVFLSDETSSATAQEKASDTAIAANNPATTPRLMLCQISMSVQRLPMDTYNTNLREFLKGATPGRLDERLPSVRHGQNA